MQLFSWSVVLQVSKINFNIHMKVTVFLFLQKSGSNSPISRSVC
uniref:Uncharacterized protein n=1 Tax=Arundo donax TaxID=35708 RepID=A0A0A9HJB0_ARUDO